MKKLVLILILLPGLILFSLPATQGAVPLEDFESQPLFEFAENLSIPGVQISGNGFYYVTTLGPGVQPPANLSGRFLFAQDDIYGYGPLTLTFTQDQATASFGWAQLGDNTLNVTGFLGGVQALSMNFPGTPCCLMNAYEGSASVTGQFDTLVLNGANGTARQLAFDNLSSTDYVPPPTPIPTTLTPTTVPPTVPGSTPLPTATPTLVPAFPIPHLSDIMITTSQAQPVYMDPAGQVVRINGGHELWLPHDYDNNGFDTYIVTDVVILEDDVWLSIFLGSENFVWVPLSKVTPLAPIPGVDY